MSKVWHCHPKIHLTFKSNDSNTTVVCVNFYSHQSMLELNLCFSSCRNLCKIWMSDTSLVWECIPRLLISFGIVAGIAICLHMTLPCDIGILIWHWPHGLWAYRADQNSYILLICLCTLMICICPVLQAEHLCICNNVLQIESKSNQMLDHGICFSKQAKKL
jgi:hypothetical protein